MDSAKKGHMTIYRRSGLRVCHRFIFMVQMRHWLTIATLPIKMVFYSNIRPSEFAYTPSIVHIITETSRETPLVFRQSKDQSSPWSILADPGIVKFSSSNRDSTVFCTLIWSFKNSNHWILTSSTSRTNNYLSWSFWDFWPMLKQESASSKWLSTLQKKLTLKGNLPRPRRVPPEKPSGNMSGNMTGSMCSPLVVIWDRPWRSCLRVFSL